MIAELEIVPDQKPEEPKVEKAVAKPPQAKAPKKRPAKALKPSKSPAPKAKKGVRAAPKKASKGTGVAEKNREAKKALDEKIRALVKKGKTQREVAKQFKITQSHVSRAVNFDRPPKSPYKKKAWFKKTKWATGKAKVRKAAQKKAG